MKRSLILLLVFVVIASCKEKTEKTSNETTEEVTQMEEIVAVHDELMPKMSEISLLITQLEERMDSTQADSIRQVVVMDLKSANEAMMTWMMDFSKDYDSEEVMEGKELTPEKEALLDTYTSSVMELKDKMEGAMERAQALLNQK